MQIRKKWQHFAHEADIGIRGSGSTMTEAFEMGAMALTAVVVDPEKVKSLTEVDISCSAPDKELLFADWLNAIIYEMDTRRMLFSQFNLQIQDLKLQAIIKGEMIDRVRHQPAVHVKGATYTELKVKQENDLWIAQCVIDV